MPWKKRSNSRTTISNISTTLYRQSRKPVQRLKAPSKTLKKSLPCQAMPKICEERPLRRVKTVMMT
jgi:hypothetical protein